MEVQIYSLVEFEKLLDSDYANKIKNVVSIGDPGKNYPKNLKNSDRNILRLVFFDLTKIENDKTRIPEIDDIKKLINYYENIPKNEKTIYIHCNAGVGRSPSVGLILLYLIEGSEERAIEKLFQVRPKAFPNILIPKLADELLSTKLLEATEYFYKKRAEKILKNIEM